MSLSLISFRSANPSVETQQDSHSAAMLTGHKQNTQTLASLSAILNTGKGCRANTPRTTEWHREAKTLPRLFKVGAAQLLLKCGQRPHHFHTDKIKEMLYWLSDTEKWNVSKPFSRRPEICSRGDALDDAQANLLSSYFNGAKYIYIADMSTTVKSYDRRLTATASNSWLIAPSVVCLEMSSLRICNYVAVVLSV